MGQKVNPYGFRLGVIRDTRSKWFAEGMEYRNQLVEDLNARKIIQERHHHAGISDVIIERTADAVTITIESAKPGIIIGRGGADVDRLRRDLDEMMTGRVRVNVEETKAPETRAQLIAEEIASQIERRASIRRAMGQAVERARRAGVDGIRIAVSGRLMGAEIARTERVGPEGSVPLHTLRADVEKGFSEAVTGYGHIGVQVYVCNGEILPPPPSPPEGQVEAEKEKREAAEVEAEEAAEQEASAARPEETPSEATEEPSEPAGEGEEAAIDELLTEADEAESETVSASTETAAPDETVAVSGMDAAERAEPDVEDELEDAVDDDDNAEEDTGDVDAQAHETP